MDAATVLAISLAALLAERPVPPPSPLPVPSAAAVLPPPRYDPWFGDDKLRHLTMSFAATSFTFAATRSLGVDGAGPVVAASAALIGGIGKELRDARRGGFFSLRDLAWDAAGVLAGYALAKSGR